MTAVEPPKRRVLKFADFEAVLRDIEVLQRLGYDRVGSWDLAQVCGHLASWIGYSVEGFPATPLLMRPMVWLLRNTLARGWLRQILATGDFPTGSMTLPETVPAAGRDAVAAGEELRSAVARFRAHAEPLQHSPLFGVLDRETATRLHLIHCAHHLGFLRPKS